MRAIVAALPLVLLLAACEREEAPADDIVKSAEKLVGGQKADAPQLAEGPFAPRDACGDLKGADEFRRQLAEAIEARDAEALVALAAEDVKLDFGGGSGRAELRKRLEAPDRKLWEELDALLALGCAANKQSGLTIPWYFEQPKPGVDSSKGMLVTGEKVALLDSPSNDGKVAATLSWDLVEIAALKPDDPFQKVETRDGQQGYIATGQLRSLLDYRLLAVSRNGTWRIVSLVAGD